MGQVHTMVWAALALPMIGLVACDESVSAEAPPKTEESLSSKGTVQTKLDYTNAELLELSDDILFYWLQGSFSGLGSRLMDVDNPKGGCIWDWYFKDQNQGFATVKAAFERYPDANPSATLLAIMGRVCDDEAVTAHQRNLSKR